MFRSLFNSVFSSTTRGPPDSLNATPSPSDDSVQKMTGSTWETHPISHPATAPWHFGISGTDTAKLLNGYRPAAMEDRWMCRSDGPDEQGHIVVHVYRSWTGDEQFQIKATFSGSHNGVAETLKEHNADITDITWNRGSGPVQVSEEEAKTLATMICRNVLGCELEMAP